MKLNYIFILLLLKISMEKYVTVTLFLHLWFGECQVLKCVLACILFESWNNMELDFINSSTVCPGIAIEKFKLYGPGGGTVCMVIRLE
jgi:hypothetical protein